MKLGEIGAIPDPHVKQALKRHELRLLNIEGRITRLQPAGPSVGTPTMGVSSSSSLKSYSTSFTNKTTVTIMASAHGLGTGDYVWKLVDSANPAREIEGDVTIDHTTFAFIVTFVQAQSGRVILVG